MSDSRFAVGKRLGRKALNIAPIVARNPRLLSMMRQGVHPEIYQRMSGRWLRDAGIRTVLDIGANAGQFSLTMHALLPDAAIYAFEPQQETFETLRAHLAISPNLHAVRSAVGDEIGEITFLQNGFDQSSSALQMTELHKQSFPWATETREVRVPISTLDALVEPLILHQAMLIKIDVQGFEDRVLSGGERTIQAARIVLIETAYEPLYEGEATFEAVYKTMSDYGFEFAGNLDQVRSAKTDLPLYADALFVRR